MKFTLFIIFNLLMLPYKLFKAYIFSHDHSGFFFLIFFFLELQRAVIQ